MVKRRKKCAICKKIVPKRELIKTTKGKSLHISCFRGERIFK